MTRTLFVCNGLVIAALVLAAPANADIVTIDSFADPFESETFVGSYSGGTVGSVYERPGLEIGRFYLGDGLAPGDPLPEVTERDVEEQWQTGLAGVLGGQRHAVLTADPLDYSRVSVVAYEGFLSYSTSFGTQGILDLTYGGAAGLNRNFMTVDDDGRFRIELLSGDLDSPSNPQYDRPVPISLAVTSGLGTPEEVTASHTLMLLDEQIYDFPFASFSNVDFADVDSIHLHIDQSAPSLAAVDFGLGELTAHAPGGFVPEPSALSLLAVGVLLLRRR